MFRPYNPEHLIVCLDESPRPLLIREQRQPFVDTQSIEHIDYEYHREGTVDLYMVVEPLYRVCFYPKAWFLVKHCRM